MNQRLNFTIQHNRNQVLKLPICLKHSAYIGSSKKNLRHKSILNLPSAKLSNTKTDSKSQINKLNENSICNQTKINLMKNLNKSMIIRNLLDNPLFNKGLKSDKTGRKIINLKRANFKIQKNNTCVEKKNDINVLENKKSIYNKIITKNNEKKKLNFMSNCSYINKNYQNLIIKNMKFGKLYFQNKFLYSKIFGNFIAMKSNDFIYNSKSFRII